MKTLLTRPGFPGLLVLALSALTVLTPLQIRAQKETAAEETEAWQVPVTLGQDGWMLYENPRFGSLIPVPPGMVALRPPDNGDGQAFQSPDGQVRLIVYGSFNVDHFGDVETRWKADLAEPGRTLTYKRKTETWYVLSGVIEDGSGTAFYERYTANAQYCSGWKITYPQAQEKKYSAWVERIAKGYQPRLGQGEDTLEP